MNVGTLKCFLSVALVLAASLVPLSARADPEPDVGLDESAATPAPSAIPDDDETPDRRAAFIMGLGTAGFARRLTVEAGGASTTATQGLGKFIGVWAGARYWYTPDARAHGGWRGDFLVGTELIPDLGSWTISASHTTAYVWGRDVSWHGFVGARVGAALDLPDVSYAHMEVGAALGGGWNWLEIQYNPSLLVPLGAQSRPTFGGEEIRSAALAFQPWNVQLVFRVW
jgi:hypothetical protein